MATDIDWGRRLFGRPRSASRTSSGNSASSLRHGVTTAASSDGYVSVLLDGSVDPVTLACRGSFSKGERVSVANDGGVYSIVNDGVASADSGDVPSSILGEAVLGEMILGGDGGGSVDDSGGGLPPVTEADNGKVMMVVGGEWVAANLPRYAGSYSVTPTADGLTVPTAGAYMESDLTVNPVPYSETSNNSGGTTIYVESEVER